mgnify:FL=1
MAGINFRDVALLTYGSIDNGRIYYARRKTGNRSTATDASGA